jgi:hypothetical protein
LTGSQLIEERDDTHFKSFELDVQLQGKVLFVYKYPSMFQWKFLKKSMYTYAYHILITFSIEIPLAGFELVDERDYPHFKRLCRSSG